ncbi:MAG: HlyD family efflux transporter periplasmic adaptor subunit [Cytophagales bacterium]|nr:HlyD family efflux transporter periplasmic adaptor subunit [Cytophagales bacterium]
MKVNKLLKYLIIAVVIIIVFVIIAKKAGWIGGKDAIEVTLAKASYKGIVEKVSASGKVQPEVEVKISPDVSGEIIDLYVEEGDYVEKGTLLLKIKPDNYLSLLEKAEAALNTAKANLAQSKARLAQSKAQFIKSESEYKRNEKLYDQKVISQADFEGVTANYEVSRQELGAAKQSVIAAQFNVQSAVATVKDAKENLNKTEIYAPVSGTISRLNVEKGERVVGTLQMAGTELLRIADLNNMEVQVDVNENDIIRVSMGDTAVIEVDSYAHLNEKFKGIVTSIANSANENFSLDEVTEFEVKINILSKSYGHLIDKKNNPYPFRPGMTASVDIITERKDHVLSVPLSSVTMRDVENTRKKSNNRKQQYSPPEEDLPKAEKIPKDKDDVKEVVFVNDNGIVKMIEVQTGISDYENIEIIKGLKNGDEIVSGPFLVVSRKLKDGDEVVEMESGSKKKGIGK